MGGVRRQDVSTQRIKQTPCEIRPSIGKSIDLRYCTQFSESGEGVQEFRERRHGHGIWSLGVLRHLSPYRLDSQVV